MPRALQSAASDLPGAATPNAVHQRSLWVLARVLPGPDGPGFQDDSMGLQWNLVLWLHGRARSRTKRTASGGTNQAESVFGCGVRLSDPRRRPWIQRRVRRRLRPDVQRGYWPDGSRAAAPDRVGQERVGDRDDRFGALPAADRGTSQSGSYEAAAHVRCREQRRLSWRCAGIKRTAQGLLGLSSSWRSSLFPTAVCPAPWTRSTAPHRGCPHWSKARVTSASAALQPKSPQSSCCEVKTANRFSRSCGNQACERSGGPVIPGWRSGGGLTEPSLSSA